MSQVIPDEGGDKNARINKLVANLQAIELELQELTGGGLDAVLDTEGNPFLLAEAQRQLRSSEATLTNTLESITDAFFTVTTDWRIGYVNREAERILQKPRVELLGKHLWETFPDAERSRFSKEFHHAMETGEVAAFEIFYEPLQIHLEARAYPSAEGLTVSLRDVTRQRARKLQLRLLEASVAHLNEGIIITEATPITEPGPRIVYLNKAFERITGYSQEETLGQSPRFLQGSDTNRAELANIRTALAKREPVVAELINYHKSGHPYWIRISINPVTAADGQVTHFVAVEEDITDQKKSVDALRDSEARYRSIAAQLTNILDSSVDVICTTDADGRFVQVSASSESVWGYSSAEMIGKQYIDFVVPEDQDKTRAVAASIVDGNAASGFGNRFLRKDGSMAHIEWSARWSDSDNLMFSIARDVTEKVRLEGQFLRAQRMESIGTLAGGIAHDLNNVLAPILMAVEILKEHVTHSDAQSMLRTVGESAQRGADLVRQVLTFARGIEGERLLINPAHIVKELIQVMNETFPKSITVRFKKAPGLWTVVGDPTQLQQVFLNLCVNARDAMPNGGLLSITMENVVVDDTYSAMNPDSTTGEFVMGMVEDTGTGISKEIADRIFEPFFTTKEIGKGTGLGLSTTMAIIKAHGGFINLYSEKGKGTRFKVYLPADATRAASEEVAIQQTRLPCGNGELILIVDDEEAIRTIVKNTFERFGYKTLTACNGAEAISIYAQHRQAIQVVLTDMAMPIMDGPALIIALKAMNPEVKVIGSSGLNSQGGVAKAVGAGVQHFVAKPYTAEAMLKTLAKVIAE